MAIPDSMELRALCPRHGVIAGFPFFDGYVMFTATGLLGPLMMPTDEFLPDCDDRSLNLLRSQCSPGHGSGRAGHRPQVRRRLLPGRDRLPLELLTDQCRPAMPPASECYVTRTAVGSFLRAGVEGRRGGSYALSAAGAGGRPALACYLEGRGPGAVGCRTDGDGSRIASIVRILDDGLHRHLEMPSYLE